MFQDGFPNNLRDDVNKVVELIPQKTYKNVTIGESQDTVEYFQDVNVIKFPYMIKNDTEIKPYAEINSF